MYDDAPCGLLTTAQDGTILAANRTFCSWISRPLEELAGRVRFHDLLTAGGRIFYHTHLGPLLQMQGSITEVKLDLKLADSTLVPVMVNVVRREAEGLVTHSLAVFVAKERHAYERELMRSRRHAEGLAEQQKLIQAELRDTDRRKDEFLAMLAHEIRNPLAPISMSAQLLRLVAEDPERVRSVADVIGRQIGHLTNLVDDLLDVSRVTRGLIELDVHALDIENLVKAAVEQARPLLDARGHVLNVQVRERGSISGDRTRLVQVLVNLLNNAAKYTPQGGNILLSVHLEENRARFDVVDDGIGIDADLLPFIFDLFSQAERTPDRSQGGLGIGLALVRSLVALHGGTIEAHSEGKHRGSRFSFWLPAVDQQEVIETAPAPAGSNGGSRRQVLIVDDNLDATSMLADVLRFAGHEVNVASSGQEALELLRQMPTAPAVCILDIGLPDMSGYELASRIRQLLIEESPMFIALTGYGQPADLVLSKAAGFTHHFVKPGDVDKLIAIVKLSK